MGLHVSFSPIIVRWCCADWAAGLVVVPAKCVWVCVNVCSPQLAHAIHMVGCVYVRVCAEGVVHGFTLMGKVVVVGCEPRLHKKRKN